MQKSALVTGAGGFIGGHLVNRLKNEGYYVVGADLKYNEFQKSTADEFIICDLTYDSSIDSIFKNFHFDEIYQLAADMGGAQYIFTGDHDSNVMYNSCKINLNILNACVSYKVPKIFYSSSACIYPDFNQLDPNNPNCEESTAYPANPDSEYGWEKLFSERLYLAFARNHNIEVHIARFHNIFGPLGTWQGGKEKSPAAICRKVILASSSIDIIGDGLQTRSFLYIDECIEGIRRLMNSDFSGPVNIRATKMISINDFTRMIMSIENKNLMINHIDGPQGVRGRCSDNTLIQQKLSWQPSLPLYDGIVKTYYWIKQQIESTDTSKNISLIGCGRVGLCLSLCLEKAGYNLLCCDINKSYVDSLNSKTFNSNEPSVNSLLQSSKNIKFTTNLLDTLNHSNIIFILVDTPLTSDSENFYDHSKLSNVLSNINSYKIKNKNLIITCTIMPNYINNIGSLLLSDCENVSLNYNPSFISQGNIIKDLLHPDIVLIGSPNNQISYLIENIYLKMCKKTPVLCSMSPIEAEIVKIATNSFIINKITFANLIGDLADSLHANPHVITKAIGSDSRIGNKYFHAGLSYGGPCFVRDSHAFARVLKQSNINNELIISVDNYNNYHSELIAKKLHLQNLDEYYFEDVNYKEKCNVIILDNSPKLKIIKYLLEMGHNNITITDTPDIINLVKQEFGKKLHYKIKSS